MLRIYQSLLKYLYSTHGYSCECRVKEWPAGRLYAEANINIRNGNRELACTQMPGNFVIMSFYNVGKGKGSDIIGFSKKFFLFSQRQFHKELLFHFIDPGLRIAVHEKKFQPFGFIERKHRFKVFASFPAMTDLKFEV